MLTKGITYKELFTNFKKGLRNGNWRKLRFLDKALFRAAMGYAKRGVSIVDGKLLEKLLELVARLKERRACGYLKEDLKRRLCCWRKGEENGMFVWAPSLRCWLKDPDYIFWLGTVR